MVSDSLKKDYILLSERIFKSKEELIKFLNEEISEADVPNYLIRAIEEFVRELQRDDLYLILDFATHQ